MTKFSYRPSGEWFTVCRDGQFMATVREEHDAAAIVAALNEREELRALLRECLKQLIEHRKWEEIEAGTAEDAPASFKGLRYEMPVGLVEISNQSGFPPEEIQPLYNRIAAALAAKE